LFVVCCGLANIANAAQDSSVPPVMPITDVDNTNSTNTTTTNQANKETAEENKDNKGVDKKGESTNSDDESMDAIFAAINQGQASNSSSQTGATDEAVIASNAQTVEPKDPLEGYNRFAYKVNDTLDKYIAKPASHIYNSVMPRPLNNMVNRAFENLDTIPTVLNDLLQANFYQATSDTWRLAINSTIGIGGAFDVAADMGLEYNVEDFGLTLAKWGWTNSVYFVIPILGPSTIRDALGRPVNYTMSVFPYIRKVFWRNSLYVWYLLNQRAQLLRFQKVFDQAAIDPYVFTRNAYLQRRAYLIERDNELNDPYNKKDMKKYYDPNYLYE